MNVVTFVVHKRRFRNAHEIGLHGWIHENLAALDDPAEEERLLTQSIAYLTKATGKRPVGIRAPSMKSKPGAWFATADQIASYLKGEGMKTQ